MCRQIRILLLIIFLIGTSKQGYIRHQHTSLEESQNHQNFQQVQQNPENKDFIQNNNQNDSYEQQQKQEQNQENQNNEQTDDQDFKQKILDDVKAFPWFKFILIVIFVSLVVFAIFYYIKKQQTLQYLNERAINPEIDIKQQELNEAQEKVIQNYQFQSGQDNDLNQGVIINRGSVENAINNRSIQQSEGSFKQPTSIGDDKCFEVNFKKSGHIYGAKVGAMREMHKKNNSLKKNLLKQIYFEVEILQKSKPDTQITIGYQYLDENGKKPKLKEDMRTCIKYNSNGVIKHYSKQKKKVQAYDFKKHLTSYDKIFQKQEVIKLFQKFLIFYTHQLKYIYLIQMQIDFQDRFKIVSLNSTSHHNIKVKDKKATKIYDSIYDLQNQSEFKNAVLVQPQFDTISNYNFQYRINQLNYERDLQFGFAFMDEFCKDLNVDLLNKAKFIIYIKANGEISNYPSDYYYQKEDDDNYLKQNKQQKTANQQLMEMKQKEPVQMAKNQIIDFSIENRNNLLKFKTYQEGLEQEILNQGEFIIPKFSKQIIPFVCLHQMNDQVEILSPSFKSASNLEFGEVMGIGLSLENGRVWVSANGEFLNSPDQEDMSGENVKGKNNKSNNDPIYLEGVGNAKYDKILKQRKFEISSDSAELDQIVPVIQANGECVVQVNIGGKPFRLYQEGMEYGLI
ncbi:hypothetical protein PPERSA_03127 [Pseudocohnilembus persalinus]|uniref:SPRY domain-containing protein n=1 Tax=Pseudocohnilembus persalinus TaxID=266149 RepID=A0A0V0QID6_PSEPJ|nr:hypothetical protein PPERSA_03127 [Pseudocohnilembus persalinus]|eukprot:KRX02065.1 hypothetical protein PPERSA_03127 [Pseudocohnilembus persalinus]